LKTIKSIVSSQKERKDVPMRRYVKGRGKRVLSIHEKSRRGIRAGLSSRSGRLSRKKKKEICLAALKKE